MEGRLSTNVGCVVVAFRESRAYVYVEVEVGDARRNAQLQEGTSVARLVESNGS